LIPRSSTAWFSNWAPVPRRRASAVSTLASNSLAWLAWMTKATGQGRAASHCTRLSSTRSGSTTGRRLWMRRRLRCGIAANASVSSASLEVASDSGSPPLRMTSSMPASAAMASMASCQPPFAAFSPA